MSKSKVARSEKRSTTPPASERRIKVASVSSPPPDRIVADFGALLGCVRKELAELWWYADQTLAGKSGCSPEVARAQMAEIVCRLGVDLNHLDDEVADLLSEAL